MTKSIRKSIIRTTFLIGILVSISTTSGYAQCTNSTLFPAAFNMPSTSVTISNNQWAQEHNQINNVTANTGFVSVAQITGTYITVRYGTYNGSVIAHGTTPLEWTSDQSGSYFIHYNTNSSCGFGSIDMISFLVYLPKPEVSASDTSPCTGESVTLTATTEYGSITWHEGACTSTSIGSGSTLTVTPTVTTTYYAKSNANGYSSACDEVTIYVEDLDVSLSTEVEPTCHDGDDGSLGVMVSGSFPPYSYDWSTAHTTATVTGLTAGTYTVSVSDSVGCKTGEESFALTEPTEIEVSYTAQDVGCSHEPDGSLDADVVGGGGAYQYAWANGTTTDTIGGLISGWYVLSITDANGCTIVDSGYVDFDFPSPIIPLPDVSVICDGEDGITLDAGNPGMNYLWSTGHTDQTLYVTNALSYGVTVTSNDSCVASHIGTVIEDACLGIDEIVDDAYSVYPNPTAGTIFIETLDAENSIDAIQILDLQGRILEDYNPKSILKSGLITLNLSNRQPGYYLISISSESGIVTKRIALK